jgi:4-azaleucine resistance transporter AzlC
LTENINLTINKNHNIAFLDEFRDGLKKGLPIGLGYISVSLTFGMMAVSGGISPLMAVFISFTNVTSAGQFAGIQLIFQTASYFEIALTVFVINIRYMLMSLSLSQKLARSTTLLEKLILAFGVTDETFAIASLEEKPLTAPYMFGLITLPIIGWTFGTFFGAVASTVLPIKLQDALGIALYAMFIALIIPEAKKSKPILLVILISVSFSLFFKYVPFLNQISSGFAIIISSLLASAIVAYYCPLKKLKEDVE